MLKLAAGPEGVWREGDIVDLAEDEVYALCEAGAAEQVDDHDGGPIVTTSAPPPEKAVAPPGRRKGSKEPEAGPDEVRSA